MEIFTKKKQEKFDIIGKVKADYYKLIATPGAMKTPIYEELAKKYDVTKRTIMTYVKK